MAAAPAAELDIPDRGSTKVDRRRARGAASRERIVEAGLEILGEDGYSGFSVSAVSKRAKISVTSLYHHFGDKAGLLAAMVDHSVAQNAEAFSARWRASQDPVEGLLGFIAAARTFAVDRRRNSSAILLALSQARADSPELAAIAMETRRRLWETIGREFAASLGIEDGTLFAHIHTAVQSYATQIAQGPDTDEDLDALFESLFRVFLLIGAALVPSFSQDPRLAKELRKAGFVHLGPASPAAR